MSDMIMPTYGNGSKRLPVWTDQQIVESMLIAAWREKRFDVLVAMINNQCGLQLWWHDPLVEDTED